MPGPLCRSRISLLLVVTTIILTVLTAHAQNQDIAGSWQGTSQTGSRVLLRISKSDTGALQADMYYLDRQATRLPVNDLTFDGSTLKFPLTGFNGDYTGKMSAGGNTIVGTWKQDDRRGPFTFTRATTETAWSIPLAPSGHTAMAFDAHPSFEVATIKPGGPVDDSHNYLFFTEQGRHFSAKNVTLTDLIKLAYGIQPRQILNALAWAETTKFDIEAEPDTLGQPSQEQYREMYRKLLTDRFKLSIHHVKKEFSVYVLEPETDGPKLTGSSGDPKESARAFVKFGPNGGFATVTFANYSMTDFARFLMQGVPDRQIVDQTGLKGKYDFSLTYAPDPLAPDAGTALDIFHAVMQQLGLKLESTKAPVDVIIIDHVEQPSAN